MKQEEQTRKEKKAREAKKEKEIYLENLKYFSFLLIVIFFE